MKAYIMQNSNGEIVIAVAENEEIAIENVELGSSFLIEKTIDVVEENGVSNVTWKLQQDGEFVYNQDYGKRQVLKHGYLTYALTNEESKVFGIDKDCIVSDFSREGKAFYWSEVYCEPENLCKIIRKGTLLKATNEELQRYHEQSKLNLH